MHGCPSILLDGVISDMFEVAMDGSVASSRAGWGENSSFWPGVFADTSFLAVLHWLL